MGLQNTALQPAVGLYFLLYGRFEPDAAFSAPLTA